MEIIRKGGEMTVQPAELEYSHTRPFPNTKQYLRLLLSLNRLNIPLLTSLSRLAIKTYFGKKMSFTFEPGFKCLRGNIIADEASLNDTFFVDYANIYVGKGTGFSFQNIVITSTHDLRSMERVYAREIVIGENVWITSRVVILPGVRIGKNSVIAAGSVVASDIPPNVLAGGVPARPIRPVERGKDSKIIE